VPEPTREELLAAAAALAELHERVCGCDDPGRLAYCPYEEFAALQPLVAKLNVKEEET
jgi:hypothetical protein